MSKPQKEKRKEENKSSAGKQGILLLLLKFIMESADKIIGAAIIALAAALILYSGYVLYDTYYIQRSAKSDWDLSEYARIIGDEEEPITGNVMTKINEDYRSWLALYDTSINYPVVQGTDDLYYASHDIYKKVSLTGAIYLAGANTPDYTGPYNLVYGHHMDNDAMFGGLDHYADYGYFSSHRTGILITMSEIYDLEVFAVMKTDAYEPQVYSIKGKTYDGQIDFIRSCVGNEKGNRTVIFDDANIGNTTQMVALSTCMSAETNGRLVVFALMFKRGEYDPDMPIGGIINPEIEIEYKPEQRPKKEIIEEGKFAFLDLFKPAGNREPAWALINLICAVITVYLWIPLLHMIEKYRRKKLMKEMDKEREQIISEVQDKEPGKTQQKCIDRTAAILLLQSQKPEKDSEPIGEDEIRRQIDDLTDDDRLLAIPYLWYRVKEFIRKFRIGFVLEVLFAAAAVITFILTEDMRLPMVLIDEWTPVMIIYMAVQWIWDVWLMRYREGVLIEDEERLCRELMLK